MTDSYPGGKREKYYTGVGSRETPAHILSLMQEVAFKLAKKNWTLRSGGADGADTAFEDGAVAASGGPSRNAREMEIYLPWSGFNGHEEYHYLDAYQDASKYQNYSKARQIAASIHPVWDKLKRGAQALHARNVYQVLGKDLQTPSKFLVCYAEPTKTGVKGGTNTAVQIAMLNNIPIFNLWQPDCLKRIKEFINE